MVIKPGESTRVSMQFNMHGAMGGPHDFRLHIPSNDPTQPDKQLTVLSNWVP
jgi:hypothetical protein